MTGTALPCRSPSIGKRETPAFARIGVMKALNRNVERVFNQSRKNAHWGIRKLKRDL
jgi:hypothetical protein